MAARPSGKKSNPPKNVLTFHGFGTGSVSVSTTYGPSPPLVARVPRVTIGAIQRDGPPVVKAARSGSFELGLSKAASMEASPDAWLQRTSLKVAGFFKTGNLMRI